jgi:aspartate racemase
MYKKIGILGGMGSMSSVYLYEMIIKRTKVTCDQDHIDMIIYNHATVPDRTAYLLDEKNDNPLPYIEKDLKELEGLGVDAIVIACNTAHFFYDYLSKTINIPILNIIDNTSEYLKSNNISKVGILATTGTNIKRLYQSSLEKYSINSLLPTDEMQSKLMDILYNIKKDIEFDEYEFWKIVTYLKDNGCEKIILGCTELSILRRQLNLDDYFVDPSELIADRIIKDCGKEINNDN